MNDALKYQPIKNIAYLLNPKVACSTIQQSLLDDRVKRIHDKKNFPAYNNPYVPIFTVVRNPYSRSISAYLDKVVRQEGNGSWQKVLRKTGRIYSAISFEQYLDVLLDYPDIRTIDKHFRPQFYNFEGITPSFIGYLEDMNSVSNYLIKHGVSIENRIPHSTKANDKIRHFVSSKKIQEKIISLYEVDFKSFGYSYDLDLPFDLKPIENEQVVSVENLDVHRNIPLNDYVNDLKEAAIFCEAKEQYDISFNIIKLAKEVRPNGPVINAVYDRVKKKCGLIDE